MLMQNKTRVIVLNESTNFNKSFNINNQIIYLIGVLFIVLFFFASWGVYRVFAPNKTQQVIKDNFNLKYNTINLLNHLISTNVIDSTILKDFNLANNYKNIIPSIMPVEGIVTKGISNPKQSDHFGIDIAATLNSKIKATQEGMVVFSGNFNEYGKTIIIAHPNNYYSLYSHLNKTNVYQRDYVKSAQIIGTVGESGKSDGPHLHFEIWKNHIIIDPRELIKEYKIRDVSIK
jgi:murein DD-endopeptidase MepM/ murein hydrolase activator NlpD